MARSSLNHVALFMALAIVGVFSITNVPTKRASKPNIVYILTDDQDLHLNSMDLMDNLQKQLIQEGTFFNKYYGHVSECCPARTSILTGKHAHNTNVTAIYNDVAGGGWIQYQKMGWHKKNLALWMQNAGYNTYYSGKILNGFNADNYCEPECFEGWSKADIFLGPSTYYYYGTEYGHYDGNNWSKVGTSKSDYSTDQVAKNVANFIEDAASSGNPFFAVAAPVAPHSPVIPKTEYKDLYSNLKIPRSPNFNPDNRTGVGPVWRLDQISDGDIDLLDEVYRNRQRCLKSVDDLIDTVVSALNDTGTLDNTYIFYSSDNGYHMGNHRLKGGKQQCFEEDINIPLIVRGPNVGKNKKTDFVTGHIDIAPTFLSLAGYGDHISTDEIDLELDGTPISFPLEDDADIQRNAQARGETTHLEFWGQFHEQWAHSPKAHGGIDMVNTYKALRLQGPNYSLLYSVWCVDSAHELYDMSWDPYQMTNLHPHAPVDGNGTNAYDSGMDTMLGRPIDVLVHRLDALVLVLKTCTGDECRWPWKQLHPNGKVRTLTDALSVTYDDFYANTYAVGKVGWEHCYHGYSHKDPKDKTIDSSLYSLMNEQPEWKSHKIVNLVKGSGSSRAASGVNWPAWLLAWAVFLGFKVLFGC